ncbi:MAG: SDR family oxidoreductase [Sinobacteraceae bacterium]|nr:SDR family oxidoreductase [Nevskiaceae bacterium]
MKRTMTNLSGKKCLITGAASGIGRALAQAAARRGAVLFLTDVNAAGLDTAVAEVRAAGGAVAWSAALDVADYAAVCRAADEIHAAHGSLDVLMNVAGIAVWGTVERLRHAQWRRAIEVNLMGPIHVMECFVPAMIAAGRGGHLVNVSSAAGLFGLPWHAPYSASKFGLRGVCEVLRFDLERHGIGVSLVCPGGVDTGLVNTVEIEGVDPNDQRLLKFKRRFQKRAVTPERAAAAILRGIERERYLVFTSFDVRLGYWAQRWFPPAYEYVMRRLNDRLHTLARPLVAPR